jgi:separase
MEENTGKTLTQTLPEGWSVVTINLTDDQNTLFISRQQGNREPIVFAVALNRQSKKEDDEDEQFTFQAATSELRDIIQSSDDTARNAKNIDTRDGRIEWWNTRKALDKRLEALLREIEFSWLGAFKVRLFRVTCLRSVYRFLLTTDYPEPCGWPFPRLSFHFQVVTGKNLP